MPPGVPAYGNAISLTIRPALGQEISIVADRVPSGASNSQRNSLRPPEPGSESTRSSGLPASSRVAGLQPHEDGGGLAGPDPLRQGGGQVAVVGHDGLDLVEAPPLRLD